MTDAFWLVELEFTKQSYTFATKHEAEAFVTTPALHGWQYVIRRVPVEES